MEMREELVQKLGRKISHRRQKKAETKEINVKVMQFFLQLQMTKMMHNLVLEYIFK